MQKEVRNEMGKALTVGISWTNVALGDAFMTAVKATRDAVCSAGSVNGI